MLNILINSVPKSGTNLLVQIAQGIPDIHTKQSMAYTCTNLEEILTLSQNELMLGHIAFSCSLSQAKLLELMKQSINPTTSAIFRKGKAGSWKQEFTAENK